VITQISEAKGSPKRLLSEQTSDSSAFLHAMCLLKRVLICEQHFSYFNSNYLTSELTVTRLAMVYYIPESDEIFYNYMKLFKVLKSVSIAIIKILIFCHSLKFLAIYLIVMKFILNMVSVLDFEPDCSVTVFSMMHMS
jgi:hypothetical protein